VFTTFLEEAGCVATASVGPTGSVSGEIRLVLPARGGATHLGGLGGAGTGPPATGRVQRPAAVSSSTVYDPTGPVASSSAEERPGVRASPGEANERPGLPTCTTIEALPTSVTCRGPTGMGWGCENRWTFSNI